MRLKAWAATEGVSYSTALRWFHAGIISGARQLPTGTIVVDQELSIESHGMRIYGMRRELAPTPEQAMALTRNIGACRFAQNEMLKRVKKGIDNKEKLSWTPISLHTEWRNIRDDVTDGWYRECSKESFQDGCTRLSNGLKNWHDSKTGGRKGSKVGFPRLRKRGRNDSWTFSTGSLKDNRVRIPRVGWVELKEPLAAPEDSRITSWTVRRMAGRWFLTVRIREENWNPPPRKPVRSVVGVDLGVGDNFAAVSGEEPIPNPRFFRSDERRIRRASKAVSRKIKGSRNRRKAIQELQVVHYRVACRRQDFLHKFTTNLVKTHDLIVLEDLNAAGMGRKKGYRLGKSVADVSLREIRRQVEYKSEWYGTGLIIADRWFASSKLCSDCGTKNKALELGDRTWVCTACGAHHDRDQNAAVNLRNLAGSSLVSACGVDVRPEAIPAVDGEAGNSGLLSDADRM